MSARESWSVVGSSADVVDVAISYILSAGRFRSMIVLLRKRCEKSVFFMSYLCLSLSESVTIYEVVSGEVEA
jgi:hypothetical protein